MDPLINDCLLTVAIPVHNAMPYLPETIDSILCQSISDFLILIVDDGSTDGSSEYLASLPSDRCRVIHQRNQGLTTTLNRMLRETTTPWLVRQDADDVSFPDRLRMILSYVKRYPTAGMFYSNARYYPLDGSVGHVRCTRGTPPELKAIVEEGYLLSICHPTVVLNVEKTLALSGYRYDLHVEDADLWWRMALRHEIQFMSEELLGFRQNANSVSSRNLQRQSVNLFWVQYLLLSHLWQKTPRGYTDIYPLLSDLLQPRHLKVKEHLREANMSIAAKHYSAAALHIVRALLMSPSQVISRIACELGIAPIVKLGANPECFRRLSKALWTEEHSYVS
jgi:glycosyltransferase involved in cell wall biosynthesis